MVVVVLERGIPTRLLEAGREPAEMRILLEEVDLDDVIFLAEDRRRRQPREATSDDGYAMLAHDDLCDEF